jgi:hypothetical protein
MKEEEKISELSFFPEKDLLCMREGFQLLLQQF